MDALPVGTMTADEEGPAIAIMVLAFAADPVMRWAWPHIHQYMAAMPRFVHALGGGAFAAWCGLLHERLHWSGAMFAARSGS